MPTALVTGATAGIGNSFAHQLAEAGFDLVLVARNVQRLDELADELRTLAGVDIEVLAADLGDEAELRKVELRLASNTRPIDMLVNNAGFATTRTFLHVEIGEEEAMLDVLVRAVLRLTHVAVRGMAERGRGDIINVSSVAGFFPRGTYGAAKSWVTSFSRSLHDELKPKGIRVMALCPGFTHTEFHQRAGFKTGGIPGMLWLEADDVVKHALSDLNKGRAVSVPGMQYQAIVNLGRHLPLGSISAMSRRVGRKR